MSFKVEIRGLDRLKNRLRKLAAVDKTVLEPETKKFADQTVKTLRATPYPARRPGQKYVRKGRLAASWQAEQKGVGTWMIVNKARGSGQPYVDWVAGDNQAWMHKGRWWVAREIIEKRIPKLTQALSQKIEAIWNGG